MFDSNKKGQHETHDKKPDGGLKLVIPFFVVLYLLTIAAFIIPLRPSYSEIDKRPLTAFPEFSWESLASGDYFDDISTWFSDTFPGRDRWLSFSTTLSELHGWSDVAIVGDVNAGAVTEIPDIPIVTPAPAPTPTPTPTPTAAPDAENAPTESTPAPAETPPQGWGGVAVDENASISLGSVIQIGDTAFNQLGFSQSSSEVYAGILNGLAEKLRGTGVTLVSAPAPTSVGVMVEGDKLADLNCARQDQMLDYIHALVSDEVVKVDTVRNLIEHNSEYIYFRTDHHWTALGAYYTYVQIMETLGYTPAALSDFTEWDQGEFEGSIYWQARNPRKLKRDNVYAYVPQGDITMTVYGNGDWGEEKPLISDKSWDNVSNKYLCFISGDNALSVITNESIPDAPNCVLVKGSFGNCFAPFLTQNYHNVYVVDYRKYYRYSMSEFVEAYDVDDIIVLPYLMATQGAEGTDLFKYILS
ncbi:MAG: hypothetical protein IJY96_07095 [Oscillospiraceae bacterium]|nr:hypothetical protein [Oscillospiraceae bacterium]